MFGTSLFTLSHTRYSSSAAVAEHVIAGTGTLLSVNFTEPPPPPSPVTLVLALPSKQIMPRILQTCTVLGVKRIFILNTARVASGYWGAHVLQKRSIRENLWLGLEQTVIFTLRDVSLCIYFYLSNLHKMHTSAPSASGRAQ